MDNTLFNIKCMKEEERKKYLAERAKYIERMYYKNKLYLKGFKMCESCLYYEYYDDAYRCMRTRKKRLPIDRCLDFTKVY